MKTDSVIKILFIENSVEDAEQVITLLRNAGIAVRPARATTPEQIHDALEELRPDLVLFNPGVNGLPLRNVAHQSEASARDIALIACVSKIDDQSVADMFQDGVQGVASRSQPKQVITVIRR